MTAICTVLECTLVAIIIVALMPYSLIGILVAAMVWASRRAGK